MLSPGKFHEQVPRDLQGNLLFRLAVLNRAATDKTFRRGLIEICRQDILFYISVFVWCVNPKLRSTHRVLPFIPWDFQEEMLVGPGSILECIEKQKPGACEKSREMGVSWLFLIVEDWLCRFHDYTFWLNISRDEDSVDDGTPNSLFGKLEFIQDRLPEWLGSVKDKKMSHTYPNGSVNLGEASTKYAGVSGRATGILLDEFSKVREDVMMRGETAGTSDCRFFVSTHEGEDKEFYRITKEPEFVKWTLHWTQHPMKNQGLYSYEKEPTDGKGPGLRFWQYNKDAHRIEPAEAFFSFGPDYEYVIDGSPVGGPFPGVRSPWYDRECRRIGDSRLVAMELDIDPISSVKTLFEPILIRELQRKCVDPYWEGDIEYEPDGTAPCLIRKPNGRLKLWLNLMGEGVPPPDIYKIGADVSGGTGATPSCLSIGSATKRKKVAEYANPFIDPKEFGTLIVAIGHLFCDAGGFPAEVAWEHRGPGVTCGTRLAELNYSARYRARQRTKVRAAVFATTYGWAPEGDNKATMLREYKNALANRQIENLSKIALEETLKFIYDKTGKIEHTGAMSMKDPSGARENHGDRATADGIMWLLIRESGIIRDPVLEVEADEPVYWHQSLQGRRDMAERRERQVGKWA